MAITPSIFAYDFSAIAPTGQTLYYNVISGGVEVTYPGYGGRYGYYGDYDTTYSSPTGNLVIPSSVSYGGQNYIVTTIGDYAFYDCDISSVTIPNTITTIDSYAFFFCSGLRTVYFNATNCTISSSDDDDWCCSSPFSGSGCDSLYIGNNVQQIPAWAFSGCSGLTSITIPNSVTSIGVGAFSGCSGLTSITISDSVTSIGVGAFSGCSSLSSVSIPNSVTSIEDGAFSDCISLSSVSIPNSVTSIGVEAFSGCSSLSSVTLPISVTSIGESAFSGCSGLTIVNFNAHNCTISFNPYDYYDYNNIEHLPFTYCPNLLSFNFGDSVTNIPAYICYGLTGLTSVTIPNSVTSIGNSAFSDCTGLTTVNFNAHNCTSAGSSANNSSFYNCSNISAVIA